MYLDHKSISIIVSDNLKKPFEKKSGLQTNYHKIKSKTDNLTTLENGVDDKKNIPLNKEDKNQDNFKSKPLMNNTKVHFKKPDYVKYQSTNKNVSTTYQSNLYDPNFDYSYIMEQGYYYYPRPYYNDVSQMDYQQTLYMPNVYSPNLFYGDNISPYVYYNQQMFFFHFDFLFS